MDAKIIRSKPSIFGSKIGRFFEYGFKLDETWSESYRVDRSGATGRRPRAKFGPQRAKKSKIKTKKKLKQGQDPQTLEI